MDLPLNTLVLCVALIVSLIILLIIYQRKNALKKRIESKVSMFKKAFDISEDAILVLSDENRVMYANIALQNLLSLPDEFFEKSLDPMPKVRIKKEWIPLDLFIDQLHRNHHDRMQSFPQSSLLPVEGQHSIPVNLYIDRVSEKKENFNWCTIIAIHDLRKEYERSQVAYRHKLTNLPNQLQAKADLNKLFSKIHLHNKKLALVLIDIDNISQIRGMIGYEQSENILIHFGQYLEQYAKVNAYYVYHTFSNNFLLCLPVIETVDEVVFVGREIQKELSRFYKLNDVPFHLTASIGASIYPDSGATLNLMDLAYKAMAEAQKSGYGHIHIYMKNEEEARYDEMEIFSAIHEAIGKEEFEVYYQPIVRTKDYEVVAAEALIRWKHPVHGYIPPDIFIPMLEKSGSIIELGRYVLSEVLKQQKRWEMFKFKPIEVSINMSVIEIESDGFLEHVTQQLSEHQVAPELIKFEITEGAAMKNESQADRLLHGLKKLGISIALDDFGTGYTSFAYLKEFPADVLKIDKSMVDYILGSEEDQRIVKAMVELGHTLGMKVVVEGVENENMVEILASFGCDYLQGYYFGKPQPAYEFQELIRR